MDFQILGPLRVLDADDNELTVGGSKPAAVLALLILHANEVVSADRLIEELWEGQAPATAAKSLQVHISRLRRSLGNGSENGGGPVVTRPGGYILEVEPERIDAVRFERCVAEGCAALAEGAHALASARLRSAVGRWRGDALTDFAYASFAQETISRLDGLRAVAVEGAIEAELALGRHAELIPELKSLVRRHPLSERLRAQLMLALYRAGRQAEALGVYRAGRRILVDQLGIEPGTELRELEHAILAQDPQLALPEPKRGQPRERAAGAPGGLLVGYEHELSALEDVLERALVGQGRVALVSGEPGVGKTRLADELTRVGQARGAQVVWARCWDGGGAPAFWPWMQVLQALVAERDLAAVRAELGDKAVDLVQLLPALAGESAPAGQSRDAQEARFRLFDAAALFLRRAAQTRPLVLVFDDLHAADPSTLALLGFMGAAALNTPILILGTYRDTDLAGNEALTEALTELTRSSDCVQLVLTGLTRDDTAHFVEVSAGVAPMSSLAAAIHEVSSGNPLFVSELVRLLRAEDRLRELAGDEELVLPRGVEQVIARRLQRLSESCRQTLSLAAVIGNEFEPSVLECAGDAHGEDLLVQLEEAKAARLIEETPGPRRALRFSHDLVRQTLYAELGGVERTRAHAVVAGAIEQLNRGDLDSVLGKLAYQYSEALPSADAATAIRYLTLAGDAAAELMAYEDATSLYRRAIEIETAGAGDRAQLGELYVQLAEQLVRAEDAPAAAAAIARADALNDDALTPALKGRLEIARAEHDLFDACVSGRERVEEVIAMFQELDDIAGEARAWSALATWSHSHARFVEAGDLAQESLVRARQAGSAALTDRALREIGVSLSHGAVPVSQAIPAVRALQDQVRNPASKARILMQLGVLEGRAGRFDEMRELFADARATAAAGGVAAEFDACVPPTAARLELLADNPTRAEAITRKSCADLERRELYSYLASELPLLAEALIAQGRLDEADAALRRGEPLVVATDLDAKHGQARARAGLELARGDLVAAEAAIEIAIEWVDQMQFPDVRIASLLLKAQILAAAGRDSEARAISEQALSESEAIEHQVYADRARELLRRPAAAPVA
jgi:DNA-binding SARP family transcriptional activator/tetratricopeptide (TPR) repeat protein